MDRVQYPFCNDTCLFHRRRRQGHQKLIAAVSAPDIRLANAFRNHLRNLIYNFITKAMTKVIIEIFKPVNVQHQKDQIGFLLPRFVEFKSGVTVDINE